MGKIYYIIGITCSGKSTLYNSLIKVADVLNIKPLIQSTSRPMREEEIDHQDYHFLTKEKFESDIDANKFVEYRKYDVHHKDKVWYYGTSIYTIRDLDNTNYLAGNGTIESYLSLKEKVGEDKVVPIFLYIDDKTLLERIISRVEEQKERYAEVHTRTSKARIDEIYRDMYKEECRRYINDIDLFSLKAAEEAGIPEENRFYSDEPIYFKVMDLIYKDIKKD